MRLVMDTLFLEELEFEIGRDEWRYCSIKPSREESLRAALAKVGLELIDYGSYTTQPFGVLQTTVRVYSKAFRERLERDAMAGRY